ncbi:hypothetical protein [Candidatus Rhabdochlamydia sp. T3358]|uniref:hypothetical protein n=1 Tax=Candidatus Rhabdochlamydia sp. T3358 TaxID=2099795 RepID=UPI0010B93512|nr:hypothetical protein [Candidatus Rhabdochlamydia sp. T3358]VHO05145.1 hypothetical protein RHT_01609 [Candidatus Rhabdochlamydia sp. T3358]
MDIKIQNSFSNFQNPLGSVSSKKNILGSPKIAAKALANKYELDMYFKPRPNIDSCNHAVAVVAAVAAIITAANGAIEAAKRGKIVDTLYPIDLENIEASGLDINQLLKIRENRI